MHTIPKLDTLDRDHLIHPQHFAGEHADPLVFVEGRGAVLRDADGREFLDGMSCLWNVNVGHGRVELAEAAAAQMRELAYASAYVGFTNPSAARLALLGADEVESLLAEGRAEVRCRFCGEEYVLGRKALQELLWRLRGTRPPVA